MKWYNYFLSGKHSRLTQGHLPADKLYDKILNHNGDTAYCCYFDLVYESLKLEVWEGVYDSDGKKIYKYINQTDSVPDTAYKPEITFTQYEGNCRPALNMVSFDFDSPDATESLKDVRKFVEWLDVDDIAVFFSGNKGFHVMVPFGYFGLPPSVDLANRLKDLAKYLKKFYPTLDDGIYNYNRKFRIPFTKHDKSGLYKTIINIQCFRAKIPISIETIKEMGEKHVSLDFLETINPTADRDPLEVITSALEQSERASYEIEKEKGGSLVKPTNFEKFDGKVCITKMLESRCDDIGRNNAALRIVNDFYRTGKIKSKAESALIEWAKGNGLPLSECASIINNIYEHNGNYNFGCQDECKASYCSYKCPIYKKLDVDKRPVVVDMPESAFKEQEKKKKPTEFEVVKRVLTEIFGCEWDDKFKKFYGGIVIKQGEKDLFMYREGCWTYLESEALATIRIKFNGMFDQSLGTRQIDNIFKMFLMYVPNKPVGVDMFTPRSDVANFRNGTLHLISPISGECSFEFKVHDKEDFISSIIEYDYDPNLVEKNNVFEEWLLDRFDGDKESFGLIQEMFGAALLPCFPQFFVLIGRSDAGKTTVIKLLQLLLGNDAKNFSKVPPHKFHGFNMASMVGKLVNIVTDIRTDVAISDDIVKQVEDRDIMRIERKGKDDLYAPLPALHIFGANDMPKTKESTSGAMIKRFKILRFNKSFTGKKNRKIAEKLFFSDAQGMVNFAVGGLMRLAIENGGYFSEGEESRKEVAMWTKSDDLIQYFIEEAQEDGLDMNGRLEFLAVDKELSIKRKVLWDYFSLWQDNSMTNNSKFGKQDFFKHIIKLNYPLKWGKSGASFHGIGLRQTQNYHAPCENV